MQVVQLVMETKRQVKGPLDSTDRMRLMMAVLAGVVSGAIRGTIKVSSYQSALASLPTVATLKVVYASLLSGDTVDLGYVLSCVTTAPANENQYRKVTDAATTAANLAACINAHSKLRLIWAAEAVSDTVTITSRQDGPNTGASSSAGLVVTITQRGQNGPGGVTHVLGR